ncbi:MAG: lytic transglycosylase domain-containing protein, partial [Desulfovibrio sp.]|nr:lytic transglycosylase domain-containing protein [Desulfovibrio sp.]
TPHFVRNRALSKSSMKRYRLPPQLYWDHLGVTNIHAHSPYLYRSRFPRRKRINSNVKGGEWNGIIEEAGRTFGLEPNLIRAVIAIESNFDRYAVSNKGAQGAMQIMPGTQKDLRLADPFDLRENIFAGCAYLRKLISKYKDPRLALAAYNAGPAAVDRARGVPPYVETQRYVQNVIDLWQGDVEKTKKKTTKGQIEKTKKSKHKREKK